MLLLILSALPLAVLLYAFVAGVVYQRTDPGPYVPEPMPELEPVPTYPGEHVELGDGDLGPGWGLAVRYSERMEHHWRQVERFDEWTRDCQRARRLSRWWLPMALAFCVAWPVRGAWRVGRRWG